jgi:hypothetical protein
MSQLGAAPDASTVGTVLVETCRRALGATATAVWLGEAGAADWQLIASHGRVPDTDEFLGLGVAGDRCIAVGMQTARRPAPRPALCRVTPLW